MPTACQSGWFGACKVYGSQPEASQRLYMAAMAAKPAVVHEVSPAWFIAVILFGALAEAGQNWHHRLPNAMPVLLHGLVPRVGYWRS